MDLQLDGKRALVTGSTSGIGEQIAKTLAAEGVSVVVHGRRENEAKRVVEEILASGGRGRRCRRRSWERPGDRARRRNGYLGSSRASTS